MKIQIDTTEKIIKIEEKVNLGELFSKLEELFPDLKWREFNLETNTAIYWTNPIQYPYYPLITYDVAGDPVISSEGTYNIDVT